MKQAYRYLIFTTVILQQLLSIVGLDITRIINEGEYKYCETSISNDLTSIYWVAFDKQTDLPITTTDCIKQCSATNFNILGLFDNTIQLKRLVSAPEPHYNVQIFITLGNCQGWQVNNHFDIYIDNSLILQWTYNLNQESFILDFPHSANSLVLRIDQTFTTGAQWGVKSFQAFIQECYYEISTKKCLCPKNYIPREGECLKCENIPGILIGYSTNDCQEVCGDGRRITNQYGCDDGNNINGDGCSSTCQVEEGWRCSGGTSTSPDICKNIAPILIMLSAQNNDNGPIITIQFNKKVRIVGQWGDVFKMNIIGDADYNLAMPVTQSVGDSFNVTITSNKSIRNSYFLMEILETQNIVDDIAQTKVYKKQHTLKLPDFSFIPFQQRQYSQQISNAASGISTGMILAFLPLLLSGNFFLIANTIEITEMIYHYQFIDVRYPFNVNQFFAAFNNFELPMVPNIFEFFYDSNINLHSPQRLQDIKIDSFFMRNSGQSFTIIFCLIFLHIIIKLLSLNCNKWKRLRHFCKEMLEDKLNYAWYFDAITTTYLNLAVSSFLQLYDNSSDSGMLVVNQILSYITFGLVWCWPFFIAYYIYVRRDTIHEEEVQEKMSSLMEGLKTDTLFQSMFQTIVFIRKLYLAFIVNFLIDVTHMQMNFLGLFNIFFILLRITYRPQRIIFQEFVNIVTEGLLFATQISIQQMKDDVNQTEEERVQSGWSIIACSSSIIVFHAIFLIYETLMVFIKYIKKKKLEKKQKKQVIPVKEQSSSKTKLKNQLMSIENINENNYDYNKPSLETKDNLETLHKNINQAQQIAENEQVENINLNSVKERYYNEQIQSGTDRNLIGQSLQGFDQQDFQSNNASQVILRQGGKRNSSKQGSSKIASMNIPINDEQG